MLIKIVLTFNRSVNKTTDAARESVIIKGRDLDLFVIEPPTITGKSGSTHGARIVRIPEMNETIRRDMLVRF